MLKRIAIKILQEPFQRRTACVTVRKNSIEALTTFHNKPLDIDLVITDQTMPGMTGSDLARRMLRIRPDLPIILCTGYSSLMSDERPDLSASKDSP